MQMSENIADFAKAMAQVQAEIGGAVKGNVNPAFKSKYADLSAVWEAWQVIGPKNGFAVMQLPGVYDPEAKTMGMDQLVTHSSGQWISGAMTIPLSKADAQGYGSACTYARRYSLAAAVGICPEDDDGNAAVQRPPRQEPEVRRIDDGQRTQLMTLATQAGVQSPDLLKKCRVERLDQLPADKFMAVRDWLEAKLPKPADAILDDDIPY